MSAYTATDAPNAAALTETAQAMTAPGSGILAADESTATMNSRLAKVGLEGIREVRMAYRQTLLETPDLGDYISGVILYDETIRGTASDGTPFVDLVKKAQVIPGIKVDTGAKPLSNSGDEKVTEGLDGLADRLKEYGDMGARFAKWRAVINIGDGLPSAKALHVNAHALARYAALCQAAGIVPIVEPEVLMTGDHSIERAEEATTAALRAVFAELAAQDVLLEGMVLKPSMVVPGDTAPDQCSVQQVAEATLRVLYRTVPAAVPGIAFLSGGQSDDAATDHLQAMNAGQTHPWSLTFSYGRALIASALETWRGDPANAEAAQAVLDKRAKANAAASAGTYKKESVPA
ncbi:MAG: fructose-bisphosphate aldolase class I [Actinomycetota bacterium]|nr:fructose-bisphosphate aldolase class I [Actinomycetota bacterium]